MDKEYFTKQLSVIAEMNNVEIPGEILEEIINISSFRIVRKGETIRLAGDDTKTAGLVLNGLLRCYYVDGEGNDITRGFAISGSLCLDEGMFGYEESIVTWEVLEEAIVMTFDVSKMKDIINSNIQMLRVYSTLLERAVRYKIYRENGFLVENATERYLHFKKLYPEICNQVKQYYIASYLGIQPESLSRIRKSLKDAGPQ